MTGYPTPVISWRKSSGQLHQGRVKYNNSALQILHVRKDDSDVYFCSASNLLGRVEKKTLLVVASLPRFIVKPPAKVVVLLRGTLRINCRASGDPKPVIRWKKQGGQLPVGRSQQINGSLVIRDITMKDKGIYICVAASAGVLKAEAVTYTEVQKGISTWIHFKIEYKLLLYIQKEETKPYKDHLITPSLCSNPRNTVDILKIVKQQQK